MHQKIIPGGTINALTPEEAVELLRSEYREAVNERVRGAQSIVLDASGNGEDDVYSPPLGFEFEVRRVSLDLDKATDPNTAAVLLGAQATVGASASATGANAALAPAIVAPAGSTSFVTGFVVTGLGATASAPIDVTLTGVQGGPLHYTIDIPAGAGTPITPLAVNFAAPIPATGPGVNIVLNVPAFGAGNTNEAATITGYTQAAAGGKTVEYLRGVGGTRIEWGQPQYGSSVQVPGVQTWGSEQGPYIRNGETFAVRARGLTASGILVCTVEGILSRPAPSDRVARRAGAPPVADGHGTVPSLAKPPRPADRPSA